MPEPTNRTTPPKAVIFNRPFGPMCLFDCPRGRGKCSVEVRPTPGDGPRWDNHGTDEQPTLTPSVNCVGGCGWHGYIAHGELSDAPPGASYLHVCAECSHPDVVGIQLGRDVHGHLQVAIALHRPDAGRPTGGDPAAALSPTPPAEAP